MSDDPQWQKHQLGDKTTASISARGMVIIRQQAEGEQEAVYLEPEQMLILIHEFTHRMIQESPEKYQQVLHRL
jgi:hypothetical protein